jgi:hypothetical protein
MEHTYHSILKHMLFGENITNREITTLLSTLGWGYTFCFVAWAVVGKIFGAKCVAPYGKFVDASSITGTSRLSH